MEMHKFNMATISDAAAALAAGRTSSRALVEDCLVRITDMSGEGGRVFIHVEAQAARREADFHDRSRASGRAASPVAGIPVSVKDLFDVAGQTTRAGSILLPEAPPAECDAAAVARLRSAGFIVIGRTNMTEFAYSGLGLNPHYGAPLNPYDRATGRIPGGSSSGAAVSVTDRMSFGALGTDTGGSCRIPAALCGIVGFKPTAARVPTTGAYPLSTTLDSVGPLAASVSCCALLDAVLAGEPVTPLPPVSLSGIRFAVPQTLVFDDIDDRVAWALDSALAALCDAGAEIAETALTELAEIAPLNAKGGFPAYEAFTIHRENLERHSALYDPRVSVRIQRGSEQDETDYRALQSGRQDLIHRAAGIVGAFDAVLMPTVPIVAPPIASLDDDDDYGRINLLMLRNPTVANFLDCCAVSIPCHCAGEAPVGLTVMGQHGADKQTLAIAAALERILPG